MKVNAKVEIISQSICTMLKGMGKQTESDFKAVASAANTMYNNLVELGVDEDNRYTMMNILSHMVSANMSGTDMSLEESLKEVVIYSTSIDKLQKMKKADEYNHFSWAYETVNNVVLEVHSVYGDIDCENHDEVIKTPSWQKRTKLAVKAFRLLGEKVEICEVRYGSRDKLIEEYNDALELLNDTLEELDKYIVY